MRLGLLESLRRILRRDLNVIGSPVGNLHGAAVVKSSNAVDLASQTWIRYTVSGSSTLNPSEVFERLRLGSSASLESMVAGVLTVTSASGTQLLHTTVESDGGARFTVRLQGDIGGEVVLYVNDLLVKRVQGSSVGTAAVNLPPGLHRLVVVARAGRLSVTVPSTLVLDGTREVLERPSLQAVNTGVGDAVSGSTAVTLSWPFMFTVGGYRVLRRRRVRLDTVADATVDETSGTLAMELTTDVLDRLSVGDMVFTDIGDLGMVTAAYEDEAGDMFVRVALVENANVPEALTGLMVYKGNYSELARVLPEGGRRAEYVDMTAVYGAEYDYTVQAFGLLDDTQLSLLAEPQYIRAGDISAPAPIELDAGYPVVRNRQVFVKFTTPSDIDYQGVKVFFRTNPLTTLTVASATSTTITIQEGGMTTDAYAGKYLRLGTEPVLHRIVSNTATVFTLETVPTAPAAVNNDTVTVVDQYLVKTDYGTPGTFDEFQFEASDYGTFLFATFDKSGNIQNTSEAVEWVYDPTDDTFTSAPILAFRQLTPTEQAYFASYTDTVRYAVLELYAYEINGTTAAGTQVYYRTPGTTAVALPLDSVQAGAFPRIVDVATEIDVPAGTRSRYIAVSREVGRVELWAANTGGYESDRVTVVIDVDDQPSITSLETIISSTTNVASVTVVVDDDTEAIGWRVDSGSWTYENTTSIKSKVLPNIPLDPGQQKFLEVVPYRYWNGGSPLDAGEQLSRNLVRTPKSFVNIDSKDAAGDRSATSVTSTFTMAPAPVAQVIAAGQTTRAGTINAARDTLTDDGSPAWSVNQWTSGNHKATFAKVTYADGVVEVRRVTSNTTGALSVANSFSRSGAVNYQLMDGAVLIRTSSGAAYLPTPGIDVRSRLSTFTYEFYAIKSGCIPESPRSIVVDADSLPTLSGVRYDFNDTTDVLSVLFDAADDDATYWEVYERRVSGAGTDHWPTYTGAPPQTIADLDSNFLRWAGPVEVNQFDRSMVGNATGEWYLVVVVKNSFGEPGPLYTDTINLGTYTPDPALLSTTLGSDTVGDDITVDFTGNPSATGAMNVTIFAKRMDNPAINSTINTTVGASQPHLIDVGEDIITSGGTIRTWEVSVTLNGYNTITKQIQIRTQPHPATVVLNTYGHTTADFGACDNSYCYSQASYPYIELVTWQVLVNASPAQHSDGYTVTIEYAPDSGGTAYSLLVSGVNAADGQYYHTFPCQYAPPSGGTATYFKYRLSVYNSLGGLEDGPFETSQSSDNLAWCSEGGYAI